MLTVPIVEQALIVLRNGTRTGAPFCLGDGSSTACPCGNASATSERAGCRNSLGVGATLRASGSASLAHDELTLRAAHMPNSLAIFLQGSSADNGGAGTVVGDGLRAVGGSTVRLGTRVNSAGASSLPDNGSASLSARGGVLAPGAVFYQCWYRNAAVAFCPPGTSNWTNGLVVTWSL